MTHIEIPLVLGYNFISFRATSSMTINEILTSSGIKSNISIFTKWDAIQPAYIQVDIDGTEYIEEGRGYCIYITSPGTIAYEGIEYTMTFDQFKSHIIQGWNLLGTGKYVIFPQAWCKIIDPITRLPVTILSPNYSYWVHYGDCIKPTMSYGTSIAIIASSLVAFAILKQFKVI
jgi:hypothetical protein